MIRYASSIVLLVAALPLSLAAQEPEDRSVDADEWVGQVMVYAWGVGMGGDFTRFNGGAPTIDVLGGMRLWSLDGKVNVPLAG